MLPKARALAAVLIVAAGGVGVAMAADNDPPSSQPTPVPARGNSDSFQEAMRNASARVSAQPSVAAAAESFRSLRAGRTPASEISTAALAQANTIARGRPFAAYRVANRSGFEFYVLKTADGLCIYQRDSAGAGGGCTEDMAGFLRGGMNYAQDSAGRYRITAFMPDGTTNVVLKHADGTSETLELSGNLATVTVKQLPERAEWTLAGGSVESQTFGGLAGGSEAAEAKTPTAVAP